MERNKSVLFVAHCLLNPIVKANNRDTFPTAIRELKELFSHTDIGIVQLPCPMMEILNGGGLDRKAKGKDALDNPKLRNYCTKTSKLLLKQIEIYLSNKCKVLGILGVETSPVCAIHQIENNNKIIPGKGIFFEELEQEMHKKRFQVPVIGIDMNNRFSSIDKLKTLLECE